MKEKILDSKLVFDGYFLKVTRDTVETPSGQKTTREYIKHPGAAMIIPILDNGKILMERQYRHALGMEFLEFPAGKIDPPESSLETAKRELKEETGYTANDWKFLTSIHPVIGYSDERIDLYLAQGLTAGTSQLDGDEDLEVVEVSHADLMSLIQKGQVTDVKTQIGGLWLEKILKGEWSV